MFPAVKTVSPVEDCGIIKAHLSVGELSDWEIESAGVVHAVGLCLPLNYKLMRSAGVQYLLQGVKSVIAATGTGSNWSKQEVPSELIDKELDLFVDKWEEGQFSAHKVFKTVGQAGFLGVHKPTVLGISSSVSAQVIARCHNVRLSQRRKWREENNKRKQIPGGKFFKIWWHGLGLLL